MTDKTTILFDLDGTLIHSAPDLHAAINAALHPLGRGPLNLATVISFVGNGVEKLVARSLDATGGMDADLHRDTLAAFLRAYDANGVALTQVYPGVMTQLAHLAKAGKKMGICTNKPIGPARYICDVLQLSQFFDVVVGAEPDQPKKPDPEALLRCLSALDASSGESLYVGDSSIDYQTAQAAGVDFYLYTRGYLNAEIGAPGPVRQFDDWSDPELFASQTNRIR